MPGAFLRQMTAAAIGSINAPWSPAAVTHVAGDRLVIPVAGHVNEATLGVIPPAQMGGQWTGVVLQSYLYLGGWQGGAGSGSTDTGPIACRFWGKDAVSSSDTVPTLPEGPNLPFHTHISIGLDSGYAFSDALVGAAGQDTGMAMPTSQQGYLKGVYDATTGVGAIAGTVPIFDNPATEGDVIIIVVGCPTDSGTESATPTITATGLSGGTQTLVFNGSGTGIDGGYACVVWEGFTGTQSAGLVCSFPWNPTAGSGGSGAISAMLIRTEEAVTAPEPPFNLSADTVTTSSFRATWEAALTGSPADSYELRLDSGAWVDVGDVLEYEFTGLDDGAEYGIDIRAVNTAGTSSVVGPYFEVTLPLPPTITDVDVTSTTVTLTWAPPDPFFGFKVRIDGGAPVDVEDALTYQWTGLSSGTAYTFEVLTYLDTTQPRESAWASWAGGDPISTLVVMKFVDGTPVLIKFPEGWQEISHADAAE